MIQAPRLDHDAMMLKRFNQIVSPNGKLERRIVANLINHLALHGFVVEGVNDGDERVDCIDMKSAMEIIFNIDEAWLYMRKNGTDDTHTIFLVLGNGVDIISDWTFYKGDQDGFNAAMDAFNAEDFA